MTLLNLVWRGGGAIVGATPTTASSGTIVYSGGRPIQKAAALPGGRLNALELDTHTILWSFSRPTAEPHWPFGFVTPVDGGCGAIRIRRS